MIPFTLYALYLILAIMACVFVFIADLADFLYDKPGRKGYSLSKRCPRVYITCAAFTCIHLIYVLIFVIR